MVMDQGQVPIQVILDLSAVFDTIDHKVLLTRLQTLPGIDRDTFQWLHSFLRGISMVVVDNFSSSRKALWCGVPQIVILSRFLFLMYMRPLRGLIRHYGVWSFQYADDTQLYVSISSSSEDAVQSLSQCLAKSGACMRTSWLKLNPSKMEVMVDWGSS